MTERKRMSDWFKMYENGLDEARIKYAIQQAPEVIPVWVWVLSECCRKKTDTIKINKYVIFGGGQTINVSPDLFSAALELLGEIEYISLEMDSRLTVLKWSERQSEYCRKKIKNGQGTDNVHLEERRGEEKRREKSKGFTPPTPEQVKEYALEKGYDIDAEHFIAHYDSQGWKKGNGQKVVSWKGCMVTWMKNNGKYETAKTDGFISQIPEN